MIIEDEATLYVLDRVLKYVKFKCNDPDINPEFMWSPQLTKLCEDVDKEMAAHYNKILARTGESYRTEWGYYEDDNGNIERLKPLIKSINNWEQLSNEKKKNAIADMVKPYKIKDETLELLLV